MDRSPHRQNGSSGEPGTQDSVAAAAEIGTRTTPSDALHQAVARVLSDVQSLDDGPAKLLEVIATAHAFCVTFLWRVDLRTGMLGCAADWAHPDAGVPRFQSVSRAGTFAIGQGLPGGVLRSGAPVWVSDFSTESNVFRWDLAAREGIRSGFAVPVRLAREVIGVVEFFSRDPRDFDEGMLSSLASLAAHFGPFIDRLRLKAASETAHRRSEFIVERLSALQHVTADLALSATTEEAVGTVLRDGAAMLGAASAAISILGKDGKILEVIGAQGRSLECLDRFHGLTLESACPSALAVRGLEPVFIESPEALMARFPRLGAVGPTEIGSLAALPIVTERMRGALSLSFRGPRSFTPDDRALLLILAQACAQALDKTQQIEATRNEEREQAARAAAEAERAHLSAMLEQAPMAAAIIAGPDHVTASTNAPWRLLASGRDVVGLPFPHAFSGAVSDEVGALLDQVDATGKPMHLAESRISAQDALEERFLDLSLLPIPESTGEETGILAIAIDVTDRVCGRRSIEAGRLAVESAIKTQDEFLMTLSHELRTPLQSIVGWIDALRLPAAESTRLSRIEAIERNANRHARVIEDLLDMASILTGRLAVDRKPTDLGKIVAAAVATMTGVAASKEVVLVSAIDLQPAEVLGDDRRLGQILFHLLSNAIKFTPPGGHVEVRLAVMQRDVDITVSDAGKGISPELLPQVFERFWQADSSIQRAEGGLGLGLPIARHLVEAHGGTVRAESAGEGHGSTFTVTLPLLHPKTRDGQPLGSPAPTASVRPELGDRRVLVVDVDADAREILGMALAASGADVRTAASAHDALSMIDSFHPHLVVSEIFMPDMESFALVEQIGKLVAGNGWPRAAIALTAEANESTKERVLAAGFAACLAKPVPMGELVNLAAKIARNLPDGPPPAETRADG